MSQVVPDDVTKELARWSEGEPEAVERLLPMVYDELRKLARAYMKKERQEHTLQPTVLVHEAYLRLAGQLPPPWRDRVHFYGIFARIMRQVLVDHARRQGADKRGGAAVRVSIEEGAVVADPLAADLLLLDDALKRLRSFDERKCQIIELRFFGGLTIDECASFLGLSTPTIVNETRLARAWLYKEIRGATAT